jgi:hypothetical protein
MRAQSGPGLDTFVNVQVETATSGGIMQLNGIHHITLIATAASRNVDFHARRLAPRMVMRTVA